jgi:hypothetical protein
MDAVNVVTMVKGIVRTYRQIAASKSFAADAGKHDYVFALQAVSHGLKLTL